MSPATSSYHGGVESRRSALRARAVRNRSRIITTPVRYRYDAVAINHLTAAAWTSPRRKVSSMLSHGDDDATRNVAIESEMCHPRCHAQSARSTEQQPSRRASPPTSK